MGTSTRWPLPVFSRVKGRAYRAGDLLPYGAVGDDHRCIARLGRALLVQQPRDAGRALDHVVVGGLRRVRPALAVTEAADVDDLRIRLLCFFIRQLEARHRLRTHVVDKDVRFLGEEKKGLQRRGLLQVEHHRALVAVGVEEDRAHAGIAERPRLADDIAVGRLDLDHVGAEVAEDLRRERSHHHRGEVEDADAGERAGHG
jgi:hypothetical protein